MIILRKQFLDRDINIVSNKGDKITLSSLEPGKFSQWLGKIIPPIGRRQANTGWFNIMLKGEKVGEFNIYQVSPKTLELSWIEVNPEHRGEGIAKAVISQIIEFAKDREYEKISLEAVGESFSNARKLYESLGFKPVKTISTAKNDSMWGGLELYELSLK